MDVLLGGRIRICIDEGTSMKKMVYNNHKVHEYEKKYMSVFICSLLGNWYGSIGEVNKDLYR